MFKRIPRKKDVQSIRITTETRESYQCPTHSRVSIISSKYVCMSYLREIPAKFIYRDEEPVGVYIQNGALKTYLLTEITFKDLEELHDIQIITPSNKE